MLVIVGLSPTPGCLSSGGGGATPDAGGDGDGDSSGDGDGDGDGDSSGDGDGDGGSSCQDLESAIAGELSELAQCDQDSDCGASYSPLCGSSSIYFDSGCYVYHNAARSLDGLDTAFGRCTSASCTPGCQLADCDCAPPPPVACVGGLCVADDGEADLTACEPGDSCIVVPYSHCCGSTKKAIHVDALTEYVSHPEWQVFDDPATCAVIGACLDDSNVTDAICDSGQCRLVYP